jgi:hypothetical protein
MAVFRQLMVFGSPGDGYLGFAAQHDGVRRLIQEHHGRIQTAREGYPSPLARDLGSAFRR